MQQCSRDTLQETHLWQFRKNSEFTGALAAEHTPRVRTGCYTETNRPLRSGALTPQSLPRLTNQVHP